jgi:hypothetical protein
MKIYKLTTKSGTVIPIEGREALDALMEGVNKGARLVMTKYGVVDSSSIDSIVLHTELMREISGRALQLEGDTKKAKDDVMGAGIFEENMKRLEAMKEKSGFGKIIE